MGLRRSRLDRPEQSEHGAKAFGAVFGLKFAVDIADHGDAAIRPERGGPERKGLLLGIAHGDIVQPGRVDLAERVAGDADPPGRVERVGRREIQSEAKPLESASSPANAPTPPSRMLWKLILKTL